MILGTVQLGLNYGINNSLGKPCRETAMKILDYAYKHQVHMLDTANAYGTSEAIIGEYIKNTGNVFQICTKLPTSIPSGSELSLFLEESLHNLSAEHIAVYYLHRFEQCRQTALLTQLEKLKEQKKISAIGVSIYEPAELEYLLNSRCCLITVVQLPFNLFDCSRWLETDLFERAKEAGIQLFARSIYLQGLLLSDSASPAVRQLNADRALKRLGQLAQSVHIKIPELAVSFIKSEPALSDYLVGCETLEQLQENCALSLTEQTLDKDLKKELIKLSSSLEQHIFDPRQWISK